jgi:hypothetical protein
MTDEQFERLPTANGLSETDLELLDEARKALRTSIPNNASTS